MYTDWQTQKGDLQVFLDGLRKELDTEQDMHAYAVACAYASDACIESGSSPALALPILDAMWERFQEDNSTDSRFGISVSLSCRNRVLRQKYSIYSLTHDTGNLITTMEEIRRVSEKISTIMKGIPENEAARYPHFNLAREGYIREARWGYLDLAQAYMTQGRWEDAAKECRRSIDGFEELGPTPGRAPLGQFAEEMSARVEAKIVLGKCLMKLGREEEAGGMFDSAATYLQAAPGKVADASPEYRLAETNITERLLRKLEEARKRQ
jgi:hypothetical protein